MSKLTYKEKKHILILTGPYVQLQVLSSGLITEPKAEYPKQPLFVLTHVSSQEWVQFLQIFYTYIYVGSSFKSPKSIETW